MRRYKIIALILVLALMSTLWGCGSSDVSATSQTATDISGTATQEEQVSVESTSSDAGKINLPDWDSGDEVTPYQFLYLICGNAEKLFFTYTATQPDSDSKDVRSFQKMGDKSVESFKAKDMSGKTVSVRVLEVPEKVHYIMDESKAVKTYLAPADFLLYRMTEAAKTAPDRAVEQDSYMLFEHSLTFGQEESLSYLYSFYMKDGVLKKLTVALGDKKPVNYEFSDFEQEITDTSAFEYPQGYNEENFDYPYTGENLPPWW